MTEIGQDLLWVPAGGALGFTIAALFAGHFHLRRNAFLFFYLPPTGLFVWLFIDAIGVDLTELLLGNLGWGLLGTVVLSPLAIKNILSQPSTPRRSGPGFLLDLLLPGLAYGLADALLLSVLPILSVQTAFSGAGWTAGWVGHLGLGALALLASLLVAAVYHLGFPEFRNLSLLGAVIGNGMFSLGYLLTGNPLAAILPHVAMHLAAVVHGRESTYQLPPHYGEEDGEERRIDSVIG